MILVSRKSGYTSGRVLPALPRRNAHLAELQNGTYRQERPGIAWYEAEAGNVDFESILGGLGQEGRLLIDSSPELAANVHQVAMKRSEENEAYNYRKRPRPVLPFSTGLVTTSTEVLHELGLATTFFTRSPFTEVARHWANVRYCGTLTTTSKGMLALSRDGDDVVYHHKVAQSEYLGVGLALVVAKEVLRRMYRGWEFTAVDADIALKAGFIDGIGAVRQSELTNKRPDYFLIGRRTDGRRGAVKVVVLECKGTHGDLPFAIRQLATACVQVETVEIGNWTPPGLMVASRLSPSGITVHVLDPPGEDDLWSGPDEEMDELLATDPDDVELEARRPTLDQIRARKQTWENQDDEVATSEPEEAQLDERLPEDLPPGPLEVVRIPQERSRWFFQVLGRTAAAAALLFAGEDDTAAAYATRRQRGLPDRRGQIPYEEPVLDPAGSRAQARVTLADMRFRGTEYVMSLPGGRRLEVFRGMEERLYSLLADGNIGPYFRTAERLPRHRLKLSGSSSTSNEVLSVGRGGTGLRIRIVD